MVRATKQAWYRKEICQSRIYVNNKQERKHQTIP